MKTLTLILTLLAASTLAGCETSPDSSTIKQSTAAPQGKPIGDTGFRASGAIETGGSVSNR